MRRFMATSAGAFTLGLHAVREEVVCLVRWVLARSPERWTEHKDCRTDLVGQWEPLLQSQFSELDFLVCSLLFFRLFFSDLIGSALLWSLSRLSGEVSTLK